MSNTDIVKQGHAAWSAGDTQTLAGLCADDFTLTGAAPMPLDKNAFVGLCAATHSATPDWSFNAHDWREEGDKVYVTAQVTGTHTGTMPSIMPGIPEVAATGTRISLPEEHHVYTLRDGKLTSLDLGAPPNGGLAAFYAQIGHPLPM